MKPKIVISRPVREDGHLTYQEDDHQARFSYSWGLSDAGIAVPSSQDWDTAIPWAKGRRQEILAVIADEFIRTQCLSEPYTFRITDLFLWVVKENT